MADNPQAFPSGDKAAFPTSTWEPGMTLLDYFAGQALAGLLHNFTGNGWHNANIYQVEAISKSAYAFAAAMLNERQSHEG